MEADLDAALEVANKWRKASGQDILCAFLPGIRNAPGRCLLARAFNMDCTVHYSIYAYDHRLSTNAGSGVGRRYGFSQMQRGSGHVKFEPNSGFDISFAEVTGFELSAFESSVALPDHIALVAWEFDHGAFPEYYG